MALTVKQQKFADEFIISGNATQAAIKAGYSKQSARKIGNENQTKPDIRAYIDAKRKEISDSKTADQKEVLDYLTSVMRGEVDEETLVGIGMGEQEVGKIKANTAARNKAAELLGRRYGMWNDNVNVSSSNIHLTIGGDDDAD
ncbi:terminase small subunit [Lacticaseibacillus mingshuiensis]|uniref:terminase small subunit n=1 Tax=Lacticaseibacillus mingshuiensis TaxID=2799574 RepID=UPI001951BB66|nr:terminase small subunit [Lacticaseibacillus mingshuiensis]